MGKSFLDHCNAVVRRRSVENSERSKEDFADYVFSGAAARETMKRAQEIARNFGESFVVWIGSAAPEPVRSFRDLEGAKEFARDLRDSGTPNVKLKRVRVPSCKV